MLANVRFLLRFCIPAAVALGGTFLPHLPAQAAPPVGTRELDSISFVLGREWTSEDVKAGPEVRGHYVLKMQGRPYAELYVSTEPLPQPQSLEQVLQAGIDKTRDKLPDYQPLGTRRTRLGELDGIVHDFAYAAGVPFRGRVYVLIADQQHYAFFFNTAAGTFDGVQNAYGQVMASIKRRARPPAPVPAAGAAPLGCEEHGLLLTLPAGWRASGDAAGAKYRRYDADGRTVASFFPMCSEAPLFENLAPLAGQLDAFAERRRESFAKDCEGYVAGPTRKLKVGDLEVRSVEYTCTQGGITGFFRWYFIPLKEHADTPTTSYPHIPRMFAFFTTQLDKLDEHKAQFDAILDSVRKKGAATAAAQPGAGTLPALEPEGEAPDRFRDPAGRFELSLPEGAQLQQQDAAHRVYAIAAKAARLEIWSLADAAAASARVEQFASGRKQNGAESTWQVGGKEARVRLFTARNDAGESMATVVACYPAWALVLAVELPAKGYADAQPWITSFLQGVRARP